LSQNKSLPDSSHKSSIKSQDTYQRRLSLRQKGGANDSVKEGGTSIKIPPVPSDLQAIELNDSVLVSVMLNEDETAQVVSTFFAAKADLNKEGMLEYGLKDNNNR